MSHRPRLRQEHWNRRDEPEVAQPPADTDRYLRSAHPERLANQGTTHLLPDHPLRRSVVRDLQRRLAASDSTAPDRPGCVTMSGNAGAAPEEEIVDDPGNTAIASPIRSGNVVIVPDQPPNHGTGGTATKETPPGGTAVTPEWR